MYRNVISFFDKLEDRIRATLSRMPILYSIIGAVGIILLWKGVWEMAALVPALFGPGSVIIGAIILLMTGLLVSFFIGDNILISGLKREKKLVEHTEVEVESEKKTTDKILAELHAIEKDIDALKVESQDRSQKGV